MAEGQTENKQRVSVLAVGVILTVIFVAFVSAVVTLIYPNFVFALLPKSSSYTGGGQVYEVIYVVLTLVTDVLYLFGGGVVIFGALMVIIRFTQRKLKDPYQPTSTTHYLSGYLTLSLNFFIGAEIVRTVVVGTTEIYLLLLVIASRGLFSLILYLERRWHGTAETE